MKELKENLKHIGIAFGLPLLIGIFLLSLWANVAYPQQTMGPMKTPQINTNYYVGSVPGTYATIQSAVTKVCAGSGGRVVIPAIASPGDTISSVTGGCSATAIVDQRVSPQITYLWNGLAYFVSIIGSASGSKVQDYVNPYVPTSATFPHQTSEWWQYEQTKMFSYNDFTLPLHLLANISGTKAYTLNYTDPGGNPLANFTNFQALTMDMNIFSPNQGGGFVARSVRNLSLGDTVLDTQSALCAPVSEFFHEGCEGLRKFVQFFHNETGSQISSIATDSLGRALIQLNPSSPSAFALDSMAEQRIFYNVTKQQNPAGNITVVGPCSGKPWFVCLTADSTLTTSLNSLLGTTQATTTVTGGADLQRYNGSCPASVVAANWGNQIVDGVSVAVNPYESGDTDAMCLTAGSTTGLSPGQIAFIGGPHSNWEYVKLGSVPDGTHLANVPLQFSHQPGETISTGAGVGWGLSTPASQVPAGTFGGPLLPQYSILRPMYQIVNWNPGTSTLMLDVNGAATDADIGSSQAAELKLNIFRANASSHPLTASLTVSGGVVTAVSNGANIYTVIGASNYGINQLPPPSITFTGGSCSVNPTFSFTPVQYTIGPDSGTGYDLSVSTGGSGCPGGLGVSFSNTYANPIDLFPVTKTASIRDPSTGSRTSGYVRASPLAVPSQWAIGDMAVTGTDTNEYSNENQAAIYSPFSTHSTRFGPQGSTDFAFVQSGPSNAPGVLHREINATPSQYYFSDAPHGYKPATDMSATDGSIYLGRDQPPIYKELGQLAGFLRLDVPPLTVDNGKINSTNGRGFLFQILCAAVGSNQVPPCSRGGGFPDFDLMQVAGLSTFGALLYSDSTQTFDVQGVTLKNNGNAVCQVDHVTGAAVNCPTAVPYEMKFQTAFTPDGGTAYYVGESGAASAVAGSNGYRFPRTCKVTSVTATHQLFPGATSSWGSTITFALIDITQSNHVIVMSNFPAVLSTTESQIYDTPAAFTIAAGDQIETEFFTPSGSPVSGTAAFASTVTCN